VAEDRYYDGKTATAHRPHIVVEGREMVIGSAEQAELARWPFDDIRVIDVNKVTGGMNFGRISDPAPRLLLLDSPARQTLLAAYPELASWKVREAKKSFIVGTSWTVAGVALLGAIYFGWQHSAAALAHMVPRSWEQRVGGKIHAALTKNLTVCKGEAGNAALRKLVDRLAPNDLKLNKTQKQDGITVDVVNLKLPNAFALPGNYIMVTSGLIDLATSPNMVSGVVAHEIGHLDFRHPTQGVINNLGISATVSMVLGGSSVGDIATLLTVMSYSRQMEHDADIRGLELLQNAGLRADGMAEFFKVMKDKFEKDGDSLIPDWLQSHPGLAERAEYTKADADGTAAMTDTEWQALKDVCKVK
jgi:Zn-dependent protease with chaperone function